MYQKEKECLLIILPYSLGIVLSAPVFFGFDYFLVPACACLAVAVGAELWLKKKTGY